MHGSGDDQPNVQKSKIQSYSVEHCTPNEKQTSDYECTHQMGLFDTIDRRPDIRRSNIYVDTHFVYSMPF